MPKKKTSTPSRVAAPQVRCANRKLGQSLRGKLNTKELIKQIKATGGMASANQRAYPLGTQTESFYRGATWAFDHVLFLIELNSK